MTTSIAVQSNTNNNNNPVIDNCQDDIPLEGSKIMMNYGDDLSLSSEDNSVDTKSTAPSSDSSSDEASSATSSSSRSSVTFDEGSNSVHDSNFCEGEYEHLWYNKDDYQHFKSSSSIMARMISSSSFSSYSSSTSSSSDNCFYYHRIIENTYEACSYVPNEQSDENPLSEEEASTLTGLYSVESGIERLGLERRCVKSILKAKHEQRDHLSCLVNTANWDSEICDEDDYWGRDVVADHLRRRCENVTILSRLFARCLAQAQFNASKL